MADTITVTANWATGNLSNSIISRQYDNNRYRVEFTGYPEDGTENLIFYLLVFMRTEENPRGVILPPVQLSSDQWLISNYFTQLSQQIRFQLCVQNEAGTFEAHSPIFKGTIVDSLDHVGEEIDIDTSALFDAYREYINQLIIAAGAVVIDTALDATSENPVQNKAVAAEFTAVNGRLDEQGENILELQEGGYIADQQQIGAKINAWLDEHPEATTTVEDESITEAKFTDALKLKTVNGYITPEMYGAKGDGTTDDYAVIQNMLDACPEQSVCVFNGTYFISSGLLITRPVNIYVYGKINVDSNAEYCVRVHGLGPRRNTFRLNLGNNGEATETWTTKSVIGLDIWASMENTYDVQIDGFTTGIRLMAGNTESDIVDCTYNKVFIRRIYNCKNAIYLTGMTGTGSLAGGTVAQNTFIGGRIGAQGASVGWLGEEDTLDNSYWGVRSDLSRSRTNNNNSFICVSFEGFGAKEAPYENRCRLTLNMAMGIYLNCRAEGMTGFYPAQIAMNPTMVIGGYAMDNILDYNAGGGKYLLPRKAILQAYSEPVVLKRSGSGNEWLQIVGPNGSIISKFEDKDFYIPTVKLLPNGAAYASGSTDKALRLKFNYTRNYTPVDMVSSAEKGDVLFSNSGHIVIKTTSGASTFDIQPIYTTVPTVANINPGTMAFVNGKPQWYDGTQWVYADGTPVPTT